jgi:hypothetical protein
MSLPIHHEVLSAGTHTPRLRIYQAEPAPIVGTTKCPESLCLTTVLPSAGRRVPPPPRTLLPVPRSYGLMRQSRVALLYFGFLASFEESLQVATSPCCYRDYPDVISANLSSDAWSHAPAVPQTADACYFVCVIGLPLGRRGLASRFYPRNNFFAEVIFEAADISLCSSLRVCSPPRLFLPLCIRPQGS